MEKEKIVIVSSHDFSDRGFFIAWTKTDEQMIILIERADGNVTEYPVGKHYSFKFNYPIYEVREREEILKTQY